MLCYLESHPFCCQAAVEVFLKETNHRLQQGPCS